MYMCVSVCDGISIEHDAILSTKLARLLIGGGGGFVRSVSNCKLHRNSGDNPTQYRIRLKVCTQQTQFDDQRRATIRLNIYIRAED